jgi:pyrroline-5-carboxylate reductase
VIDPHPSDWLTAQGVSVNGRPARQPRRRPAGREAADDGRGAAEWRAFRGRRDAVPVGRGGHAIASFEAALGAGTRIVRAMPNTPAAIGQGITAIVGNAAATAEDLAMAEALLSAVGQVVRLDDEDQIDAVTGVSGSGPAYVFYMIDALAAAGEAEGLAPDLAMALAKATVAGAGALARPPPRRAPRSCA